MEAAAHYRYEIGRPLQRCVALPRRAFVQLFAYVIRPTSAGNSVDRKKLIGLFIPLHFSPLNYMLPNSSRLHQKFHV